MVFRICLSWRGLLCLALLCGLVFLILVLYFLILVLAMRSLGLVIDFYVGFIFLHFNNIWDKLWISVLWVIA